MKKGTLLCFLVMIMLLSNIWFFGGIAQAKTLTIGTNPVGSLYYAFGTAFSKVLGAHTSLTLKVLPQSSTVWYPMLQSGEIDLGLTGGGDPSCAYAGKAIYEQATKGKGYRNLRLIMVGAYMQFSTVVRANSGIKTGQDLKGKRVVTEYGAHFSAKLNQLAILSNLGLTLNDFVPVPASSYPDGIRAIIEGRADSSTQSIGSGIIEELAASPGGAYTLPLDPSPQAVERMRHISTYDVYIPDWIVTLCQPGPAGIDKAKYVLGSPVVMLTALNQPEEVIYTITKTVWENYKELAPIHPQLKLWVPKNFATVNTSIPYHVGAVKCYKEVGVWTNELEKHQQKLQGK
jgi:TRAP transporter TAXI family solute receptor